MSLSAGSRIGPYEILGLIGSGGMGEVYRARDSKLKRVVALKVLPDVFARDPERMARFQREAEVLASLNHPNIAQIYGVEDRALVMELVEGESPKGPKSFEEAWKIAAQIAIALDFAHHKGIIHRDLKPANIKVTAEGVVKLLDFGLAKAFRPETAASADPDNSPTLTLGATQAGVVLGTAAYMSPEQAKGKSVDQRADIWSFGVVLYELLVGERLFRGEDVSDILAQVLTKQPDLDRVPAQARKLLRRCLERDVKKRLENIGEAQHLILEPLEIGGTPSVQARLGWVTAAVLLLALAAVSFLYLRQTPPAEPPLRATIGTPEGGSGVHSFAISPDGHYLVMAAEGNGKRLLWLRAMDAPEAQPIPLTEDATYPFWSPDSRYIGFFAQGKLKKVAVSGGPAQPLCDAPDPRGGTWSRDDVIIFSPAPSGIWLQRVPAAGGAPVDVMKTKGDQRNPVFLPDRSHFLYLARGGGADKTGVFVGSLDGTENRRILADASTVAFAPSARGSRTGHLLFVRDNILMAVPFDAAAAQLSGDVFPVAENVSLTTNNYYLPASASDSGVLLYATRQAGTNQIGWYDRSGKSLGPVGLPGAGQPAISPDEKSIVYTRGQRNGGDVWVRDLNRGTETRLTRDTSTNLVPSWSPQGDRIVFGSNRTGVINLYRKASNGSGQDELLLPNSIIDQPSQWSRDGRFIVYVEQDPKNKFDLWVLPTEGSPADRKPIPFLRTEAEELFGQLSPDSHWMAYTSDRSGRREVYVRPFPAAEGEWTISIAGGQEPRWKGDGKELFYDAADGKMMAVPVKKAIRGEKPVFEVDAPMALFDAHMVRGGTTDSFYEYDVTADGKRFLISTSGESGAAPLTVVVNWLAGVKK